MHSRACGTREMFFMYLFIGSYSSQ